VIFLLETCFLSFYGSLTSRSLTEGCSWGMLYQIQEFGGSTSPRSAQSPPLLRHAFIYVTRVGMLRHSWRLEVGGGNLAYSSHEILIEI